MGRSRLNKYSSTLTRRLGATGASLLLGLAGQVYAADVPEVDLRFGALAGLSGDLAQSGQPWAEAVRIAVEDVKQRIDAMGYGDKVKISFVGAEDSQGNAQGGIEAAKKLTGVDGANIVVGDFFSSVTVAAAQSVFIPNKIIDFTGGTAPSITDLNVKTGTTWVWRMVPPDSVQGSLVAKVMGNQFGAGGTVNVAARNDTYGVGLVDEFTKAWQAAGGKIGASVIYNPDSPTLDTEAQQLAAGSPDAWFIVSFCGDWGKLKGPLQRTGAWDPKRTFGGDALYGCPSPNETLAGMRTVRADTSSGESNADWEKLYHERVAANVPYASFTVQAFDAPYIATLAALKAGSDDPDAIREQLVAVTNGKGPKCSFVNFEDCVKSVLAGETPQFMGASGSIGFDEHGDPTIMNYNIAESKGDGAIDEPVVDKIQLVK